MTRVWRWSAFWVECVDVMSDGRKGLFLFIEAYLMTNGHSRHSAPRLCRDVTSVTTMNDSDPKTCPNGTGIPLHTVVLG